MLSYFQGHRPFAKLCATRRHRGASKGSRRVVVRGALARHGVREALALDGPCHRDRFYPLPRSYDQSARAVDEPISSSRATLLIDRRTLSYAIFMFVLCVCVHACALSLLQSLSLSFAPLFHTLSLSLSLSFSHLSLSLSEIHSRIQARGGGAELQLSKYYTGALLCLISCSSTIEAGFALCTPSKWWRLCSPNERRRIARIRMAESNVAMLGMSSPSATDRSYGR